MDLNLIWISIVEGITEFLPVSSTAHLILASKFLSIDLTDSYIKFYILFIQFGALTAGIFLFSKKLLTDKKLFINVCVSFIPGAIVGFTFYKLFKKLLEGNMILLASALAIGGIIFIYLEKVFMKKRVGVKLENYGNSDISIKKAFIIGIAQAIAIVPGVSRSGATIIAGILLGIKKSTIIEYTFFLATPTIGAAIIYDAYKSIDMLGRLSTYGGLIAGFMVACITALITLLIVEKYLPRISLTAFGWYRVIVAIFIVLLYL